MKIFKFLLVSACCATLLSSCKTGKKVDFDQANRAAGSIDRVHFDFDKDHVKDSDKHIIPQQASWIKDCGGSDYSVLVEGHTDPRGTREYNIGLGERRANNVKNDLINAGVEGSRISTVSYGKDKPAVVGNNEEAYAQDRRAVTTLQKQQGQQGQQMQN